MASKAPAGPSYWQLSRAPRYSVTFAIPLFLLYEGLAAALSGPKGEGVRNGADVILKGGFARVLGERGPLVFTALLVLACVFAVVRDIRRSKQGVRGRIFAGMMGESVALASAFGLVIGLATTRLLHAVSVLAIGPGKTELDAPTRLMVSLGAGLYEELLFRVLLVSGLVMAGKVVLGLSRGMASAIAVVVGALVFSAFHYIGPYGDPFRLDSFTFRALSGLAFSALYVTRGFGVTAWTHALYDVIVLIL